MTVTTDHLSSASFRLDYGPDIEPHITGLVERIESRRALASAFPARWLAVKLLEDEADIVARVQALEGGPDVAAAAAAARDHIGRMYGDQAELAIADARYGYVHGVVRAVVDTSRASRYTSTDRLDAILTNRWLGMPLFFAVMFVMFKLVVEVSAYYLDWIDAVISGPISRWLAGLLALVGAPDRLESLAVEGILAGVGAVLVFLPGLLVLFFFLTLLEDSGYMARVAFVMDRAMRFTGLHGKSFIPMILGFGCAVPAVYATRTLESRRQRIATSLLVPLMSCSARLPVYVVFGLAFFSAHSGALITGLYIMGVLIAAVVGFVLGRTLLRGADDTVFALELPPYRLPTLRAVAAHTWQKTREFIVRAGTVILAVSVVLWGLMNLPWGVEDERDSYFGQVSAAVAPAFAPAGFGTWEAAGALASGFIAKEVVISTMAQAYVGDGASAASPKAAAMAPASGMAEKATPAATRAASEPATGIFEDLIGVAAGFVAATDGAVRSTLSIMPGVDLVPSQEEPRDTALSSALAANFTPLAALAFVVFVLVYTPCVATLSAIRAEHGWRWMALSAGYQLALAWLLAVVVFQLGSLLGSA